MFRISDHAARRIRSRNISPLAICAALEGERVLPTTAKRGTVTLYDRASRVAVILDANRTCIITVYKVSKATLKRAYSR
jgi:hypothetical protein